LDLREALLARAKKIRVSAPGMGGCPAPNDAALVCPRFRLVVSPGICERCEADPLFRQGLHARYLKQRTERQDKPCIHRSPQLGERRLRCCGNKHEHVVGIYLCRVNGSPRKVADPDCWMCEKWEGK